jgi:hypothetical protein
MVFWNWDCFIGHQKFWKSKLKNIYPSPYCQSWILGMTKKVFLHHQSNNSRVHSPLEPTFFKKGFTRKSAKTKNCGFIVWRKKCSYAKLFTLASTTFSPIFLFSDASDEWDFETEAKPEGPWNLYKGVTTFLKSDFSSKKIVLKVFSCLLLF